MKTTAKQYKIYLTIGIIALFAVIFSATYAIFRISATQTSNNMISILDCIDISITGNTSALSLTNSYPLNDAEGSTQLPYRFTVQNNCSTFVEYQIIMSVENSSTITNKEYIKIDLDGLKSKKRVLLSELTEEPQPALTGYKNNYTLLSNSFNGEESHVYNFRMWLNGDNEEIWTDETISDQSLSVRLSIIGVTKTENPCAGGDCLGDKILAQGGGTTAIEAKGTPSFSVINGTSGLYATEDEYGTSYYYRGLKTELNNKLIWGGFQWKIVRINGDGSIRLVYNGTEAQFNTNGTVNDTGVDTQIAGTHSWNTNNNDAKYVGYMYGGSNGSASSQRFGTTSVSATYNQTDTRIKTVLDSWYKTNINDKGFGSQVADNLFCNDRQLRSEVGGGATGPGYGNTGTKTYYAAYHRLETNKTPTLKCGLQNDQFTTSVDGEVGNGALTYPVGLLTGDEVSMSGLVRGRNNYTNYLYTNQHWWSFSPFVGPTANVWYVDNTGYLNNLFVNGSHGVRPSVSLIPVTRVTGEGSASDPFVVVTAPTLGESILAQEDGPAVIEAKGEPDFSEIATSADTGLYAAPDEYGTSYYYRGLKTELNNNLIWGGFQWKIVRINGDGSIRLLYNGTEAQFTTNGTMNSTGEDTQISNSAFNATYYLDAKYVGYMYGGANGEVSTQRNGLVSVAATYNETTSTIKGVLDNWYSTNILEKPFESQIKNNLFCNDRQLQSEVGGESTGPGYGNNVTYYASLYRLEINKIPTLKCGLQNDRFTTNEDTTLGNGALTHPVGLLTADEASMAGLVFIGTNSPNYLNTNVNWWLLSPLHFSETLPYVLNVESTMGMLTTGVHSVLGVRPTLSISSTVRVTGTGSAIDPYIAI